MDLTGKLIIKARLGDDIRRIPIHNEDLTYDELILMMQRVFKGKLSNDDDVTVKYADEDGDLITLFDDSDITLAIQMSRKLKLTLFVDETKEKELIKMQDLSAFKSELVSIRNKINGILDSMSVSNIDGEKSATESVPETSSVVAQPSYDMKEVANAQTTDTTQNSNADSIFDNLGNDSTFQQQSVSNQSTPSHTGTTFTGDAPTQQPQNNQSNFAQGTPSVVDSSFGISSFPTGTQNINNSTYGKPQQPDSTQPPAKTQASTAQQQQPTPYGQQLSQPYQNNQQQMNQQSAFSTIPKQPPQSQAYAPVPTAGYPNQPKPGSMMAYPASVTMANSTYSTTAPKTNQQPGVQQPPNLGYQQSPSQMQPTGTYGQQQYGQTSQQQQSYSQPNQPPPTSSTQSYGGYPQQSAPQTTTAQPYSTQTQPTAAAGYPPTGNYYSGGGAPPQTPPGNPHRIMRGAGSYRMRQPGPGYQ